MRHTLWAWVLTATAFCVSSTGWAAEIAISCGAVGQERELCEQAVKAWSQESGHTVKITHPPEETNQRYFKYLVDLGDGRDVVDVYQIDVIWPGLLGRYFIDLKDYIPEEAIQHHHPEIIRNNTVDGRLVGMPWFTDVGLLYYRKDLLEKYGLSAPQDWSELADTALYIQTEERKAGAESLWGLVFQGNAYEGLTCNALEWIGAYGGGGLVDEQGEITVDNPHAILAVARAASWINSIAPPRVLSYNETDTLTTFQNGDAVFMRNWPYAWGILNHPDSPLSGKVDVASLPKGGAKGRSAGVLGGWQLAVAKTSKHPEVAADLVRYLTGVTVQKQRAIHGAYAPTIMSLYDDHEVLQANPFFAKLRSILDSAIVRPAAVTGAQYMQVSTHFWEAVHDVLQGNDSAADSLARLRDQLKLAKNRGSWAAR